MAKELEVSVYRDSSVVSPSCYYNTWREELWLHTQSAVEVREALQAKPGTAKWWKTSSLNRHYEGQRCR